MSQRIANLPVGAKVKFGRHSINGEAVQDIIWLVVAKNHSGYPDNSVTLFTEKVIDIRSFDAKEPESDVEDEARKYGLNIYTHSNIRHWLCSNARAGEVNWGGRLLEQTPTNEMCYGGAGYAHLPGFLNPFTPDEQYQILTTSVKEWVYSNESVDSDKVFLPNPIELGINSENTIPSSEYRGSGTTWEYFTQGGSRVAYATNQVQTFSTTTRWSTLGGKDGRAISWFTRARDENSGSQVWYVDSSGKFANNLGAYYNGGIRPALNLSSNSFVTDTTDGDGCYVVLTGAAPSAPKPLSVPTVMGGRASIISWGAVNDPSDGVVIYDLQCSVDGGEYSTLYRGVGISYTHAVEFGARTVQYRVSAIGSNGIGSDYTVSNLISVINNVAPTISGTDRNLGTLKDSLSVGYVVTDTDESAGVVTVTESIDGVPVKTHTATLGQSYTFSLTGDEWLKVSNGSHTATITATDSHGSTAQRTYSFTKNVTRVTIQTRPMDSTTMPSRIVLSVTRAVPFGAIFKVEVCNNGYDASPTWEDATVAVTSSLVYAFENVSKTANNWGVMVRVTLDRNGTSGACYISSIGGNFE